MTHPWCSTTPIRGVADIAALERVPLEQRVNEWDLTAWLRRGCAARPERVALTYYPAGRPTDPPSRVTFAELLGQATQVANLLHQMGVRGDDCVMLLAPTLPATYVAVLGALARGILCPVNWMLPAEHIAELVRAAQAKVLIALGPCSDFEIWENLQAIRAELPEGLRLLSIQAPGEAILPECDLLALAADQPSDALMFSTRADPEAVAAYVHSGGTTGTPKLVRITNRGIVHKSWCVTTTMAHAPDDILFSDMPMFHIAGLVSCAIMPLILGSSLVIPTPMGARDKVFIGNFWKFVQQCQITFLHAVPTILGVLARNPPDGEDISCLRDYATTGSTALPSDVAVMLQERIGIRLLATYGATEFCQNVTQAPRDGEPRFGSAGIRNPYTDIRVVVLDEAGLPVRDCAVGEIGAVLIRSPGTTPGYVGIARDPRCFLPDGWINNGDLGRLDAEGYLWLTGRAKDLIIRGGHNIDPALIEEALRRHPAVMMVAAIGKPDAYAGELPIAYVQLVDGASTDAEALVAFARGAISERAAVPQEIVILPELPLTDVRKIAKTVLRYDAIARVFTRLLSEALGRGVTLEVGPDPQHGTLAMIIVQGARDPAVEARCGEVLAGFAIAWRISWR